MGFHFGCIVALLYLGVVGSCHASMPAELYWNSVFPNTPMPKSLLDLLPPVNKNVLIGASKINYQHSNPSAELRSALDGNKNWGLDANKNWGLEGNKNWGVDGNKNWGVEANKNWGLEGNKNWGLQGNKNWGVDANKNWGLKSGSHLTSNASIYFFESDLHPGRLMKLPGFTKTENRATFLPRAVADSMPFSSNKIFDILKLFSMDPKSSGAKVMKQSIEDCERAAIEGEDRYCATSLESLIDLSVSRLGKKIQVLSTEVEKETKIEKFTIGKGVKNMGEKNIVCHKSQYPYAVFLCHSIDKTDVYKVPLIGSDGTKVKATAVCHKDTSPWNPRHLAFQLLKVKPGSVPICHFLAKETVVLVPN